MGQGRKKVKMDDMREGGLKGIEPVSK